MDSLLKIANMGKVRRLFIFCPITQKNAEFYAKTGTTTQR
jgi:hypothetical protein